MINDNNTTSRCEKTKNNDKIMINDNDKIMINDNDKTMIKNTRAPKISKR